MTIIGIIGRKGSGKDTVASIIGESKECTKLSFAAHIKLCCATIFGFPSVDEYFEDRANKEVVHPEYSYRTPRELLQWFGTIMKSYDPKFWINRVINQIDPATMTIITDVRFVEEAEALMSLGAAFIYVEADERLGSMGDSEHVSETAVYSTRDFVQKMVPERTVVVRNNHSLEYLQEHLKLVLPSIGVHLSSLHGDIV